MSNVCISADSTCDPLPPTDARAQRAQLPLPYRIQGEETIWTTSTSHLSSCSRAFTRTNRYPRRVLVHRRPYRLHFEELQKDGDSVVHFNLGSALSAAYNNACEAASQMKNVHVVDGKSLSTGVGLQVLAACRMRDAGMDGAEIARTAEGLHNRAHASFVLDTMEFLAAGGRCPRSLVAYLGGKLSCRPGILVDNQSGAMKVGHIYRGKQSKVLQRYVEDTLARYPDVIKNEIFITHSGVSDDIAQQVRAALVQQGFRNIYTTIASCTISSHCGPGTLGTLFMTESECALGVYAP